VQAVLNGTRSRGGGKKEGAKMLGKSLVVSVAGEGVRTRLDR